MEIRNNTPSFGMAFIKPGEKTMRVLEKYVEPKSFDAFVKEQAKCKYFDIVTTLDRGLGKDEQVPLFKVVAKSGVNTHGYSHEAGFHSQGFFDSYQEKTKKRYLNTFGKYYTNNNFKSKLMRGLANFLFNREMQYVKKNHPELLVNPALRAAGDMALKLDAQVDEANEIFKIAAQDLK